MLFADFIGGAIIGGIAGGIAGAVAVVVMLIFKKPLKCPECGEAMPKTQFAANFSQMMNGSRNCKNCGCEVDRKGRNAKS